MTRSKDPFQIPKAGLEIAPVAGLASINVNGSVGGVPAGKGGLQALAGVVQRAKARGFAAERPREQPETWVEGDYRYTRLASGVVVKDSLATAPLR